MKTISPVLPDWVFMRNKEGKSHLRGTDRSKVQMLPPCLDDYVPAELSLSALAYNLRRELNLKPMSELLGALPTTA